MTKAICLRDIYVPPGKTPEEACADYMQYFCERFSEATQGRVTFSAHPQEKDKSQWEVDAMFNDRIYSPAEVMP